MKLRRVIVTKHRLYELADDAQGQPVEDAFRGPLPAWLKGAKVYEVDGRKVIARPDDEAQP